MAIAVADAPETIPGIPDDVADPAVPPGATAPLPARTLDELYDALGVMSRILDGAFAKLPSLFEHHQGVLTAVLAAHGTTLSTAEASALQHLTEVLGAIQTQGFSVMPAPYSATVQATMPSGFAVHVTIAHRDGGAFLEALGKLEAYLQSTGYTPVPS